MTENANRSDLVTAPKMPSRADADRIIDYGLTICMYGERAPGGDENWHEYARRAEDHLRRVGCAERGFHTPADPSCPDCKIPPTEDPR